MRDCIFCKIADGDIPSNIAYRDDDVVAFHDIHPQAPTHILVIPTRHIASTAELTPDDQMLAGSMIMVAKKVAEEAGLGNGYRLVLNTGRDGGQEVQHLHLHVLGGRRMKWPPG
jgi:histidine triad (HIT) family protein